MFESLKEQFPGREKQIDQLDSATYMSVRLIALFQQLLLLTIV